MFVAPHVSQYPSLWSLKLPPSTTYPFEFINPQYHFEKYSLYLIISITKYHLMSNWFWLLPMSTINHAPPKRIFGPHPHRPPFPPHPNYPNLSPIYNSLYVLSSHDSKGHLFLCVHTIIVIDTNFSFLGLSRYIVPNFNRQR